MTQNDQQPESTSIPKSTTQPTATPLYAVPVTSTERHEDQCTTSGSAGRVQVSEPADVLAYIQCTLGFRPTNSIVIVAFADNQLSTVVRCDIPHTLQNLLRSDTPESVTFMDFGVTEIQELQFMETGRHIGQLMAQEPSTTSCLLLYLADETSVSDQQALAAAGTANAMISAQFGLQRMPVEESWLIHHDLLWHLRCAATTECGVQGDHIGDPEQTPIFSKLDPTGATAEKADAAPRKLLFPPVSVGGSSTAPDTQALLEHRPHVALKWLHLWDRHIYNGPSMLHSDEVAELLSSLEHPKIRDAILALVCFDATTALRGMVTLGKFPTAMGTAAQLPLSAADGLAVEHSAMGRSKRGPDWQRIGELERLCHQLLPLSDDSTGGVVAAILAWIEWVRGRGSVALRYVRQARKRFPAEQFLSTLEGHLKQGTVAGWATRVETAWNPQHAA